uniref:Uncharacterized protein n=1 Tax=Anguilla anguilla TaxID=7936 RepID=A0A0E9XXF7_ANGAN
MGCGSNTTGSPDKKVKINYSCCC